MTAKDVAFHPEAAAELLAAVRWYRERSRRAALHFVAVIRTGVDFIADGPARCPFIDTRHRRWVLPTFPYSLIFREQDNAVQIVAVAHARRRPGYWRKRA